MKPVTAAADVLQSIARVKSTGRGFGTNFFMPESAVAEAVSAGELFQLEGDGAVALVRRQESFDRVYYAASSPKAAAAVLSRLSPSPASLVADVVGREADTAPWIAACEQAGFSVYTRFHRMSCSAPAVSPETPPPPGEAIHVATPAEAPELRQAIAAHFDPYAERIPSLDEVHRAAAAGSILVYREQSELAALLYFETQGVTTHLRYWLGLPAFRGRGYAHALMIHYLASAVPAARRFILWVEESNRRAIPLYQRYGYARDGMSNAVLRKLVS